MASNIEVSTVRAHLDSLSACDEAMTWLGDRTAREAWEQCERPDWLLWWAGRTPVNDRVVIVRVACTIARTVLHLVKAGEDRPRLAIEAAEAWCAEPNEKNRYAADAASTAASYASYDASYAASFAAAAAAADAASFAAAADAASTAASYASYASYASSFAADAFAADAYAAKAARDRARAEYCVLIRQHLVLPWEEPNDEQR